MTLIINYTNETETNPFITMPIDTLAVHVVTYQPFINSDSIHIGRILSVGIYPSLQQIVINAVRPIADNYGDTVVVID